MLKAMDTVPLGVLKALLGSPSKLPLGRGGCLGGQGRGLKGGWEEGGVRVRVREGGEGQEGEVQPE